jgi:rhodanese-related sulfurtransferase
MAVKTITPSELAGKAAFDLVDVRTPGEFETVHASGARLVPLDRLNVQQVLAGRKASADEPLYLICKSGGRSAKACEQLMQAGLHNVVSVAGGTEAWQAAGLPVEKRGRRVLPLDRQMQLTAGTICFSGAALGFLLNPWFYAHSAMVWAGLMMAGAAGFCPLMLMISRMPWNKGQACGTCCSSSR